jgi:hypothetical protein
MAEAGSAVDQRAPRPVSATRGLAATALGMLTIMADEAVPTTGGFPGV